MNNSQAIDIFNMIYIFALETFYDHVNQYSVKRTMIMLTVNIKKMTYLILYIKQIFLWILNNRNELLLIQSLLTNTK